MEDHIEHQQEVLQLVKENLDVTQNSMKQKGDRHRSNEIRSGGMGTYEVHV